jgi:transcriptional regulator with XRE-family HTH domain
MCYNKRNVAEMQRMKNERSGTMNLDKLRGALAEQRITQEMLAKKLEISLLSVNRKLNGKSPITVEEAKIIADFAKIQNPAQIFFD